MSNNTSGLFSIRRIQEMMANYEIYVSNLYNDPEIREA